MDSEKPGRQRQAESLPGPAWRHLEARPYTCAGGLLFPCAEAALPTRSPLPPVSPFQAQSTVAFAAGTQLRLSADSPGGDSGPYVCPSGPIQNPGSQPQALWMRSLGTVQVSYDSGIPLGEIRVREKEGTKLWWAVRDEAMGVGGVVRPAWEPLCRRCCRSAPSVILQAAQRGQHCPIRPC